MHHGLCFSIGKPIKGASSQNSYRKSLRMFLREQCWQRAWESSSTSCFSGTESRWGFSCVGLTSWTRTSETKQRKNTAYWASEPVDWPFTNSLFSSALPDLAHTHLIYFYFIRIPPTIEIGLTGMPKYKNCTPAFCLYHTMPFYSQCFLNHKNPAKIPW